MSGVGLLSRVLGTVVACALLAGVYLAWAPQVTAAELVAGCLLAAGSAGVAVATRPPARARVDRHWFLRLPLVLLLVPVDVVREGASLARGRRARPQLRTVRLGTDSLLAGAVATIAMSASASTYVVDDGDGVTVHSTRPGAGALERRLLS